MRRDHRPFALKKAYIKFQKLYTRHFLRPQLESLGRGFMFMAPWHVALFGGPIRIGDYATVIATSDRKVRFSVWPEKKNHGWIQLGDCCLVCPGVRISSARGIVIGDSCMIASGVYITDADWHGLYDRISLGETREVRIEDNVWIGDGAIVCKGVTIGENSIIGAGAVVVDAVPANCVAAGNPARVVKKLDPRKEMVPRARFYADPRRLSREIAVWDRALLEGNTLLGWLRHLFFPEKGD